MIDYLFRCADRADLVEIVPRFFAEGEDGNLILDTSRAFWTRIYVVAGTETVAVEIDNETIEETIEVRAYEPWEYLWATLPDFDQALADLPACMIVADREAAARGEDWLLASRIDPESLGQYRPDSVPAGSGYFLAIR